MKGGGQIIFKQLLQGYPYLCLTKFPTMYACIHIDALFFRSVCLFLSLCILLHDICESMLR